MRKILLLAISLFLVLSSFYSCGEKKGEDKNASNNETVAETTTSEPTVPETTTAPGPRKKYSELILFVDDGTQIPVSISDAAGTVIGMKFTVDFIIESIDILCPSWSDNTGKMTFALYKWDTDYATTIAGTPVNKQDIVDYEDNILVTFPIGENEAPEGTYLWTLSDGTGGVGTWAVDNGINTEEGDIMSFKNGEESKVGHKATVSGYKMVE